MDSSAYGNADLLWERLDANLSDRKRGVVLCGVGVSSVRYPRKLDRERVSWYLAERFCREIKQALFMPFELRTALTIVSELSAGSVWKSSRHSGAESELSAKQFFSIFGPDARCYSTYEHRAGASGLASLGRGRRLTDCSWDAGVVFVDSQQVGIVWVGDED